MRPRDQGGKSGRALLAVSKALIEVIHVALFQIPTQDAEGEAAAQRGESNRHTPVTSNARNEMQFASRIPDQATAKGLICCRCAATHWPYREGGGAPGAYTQTTPRKCKGTIMHNRAFPQSKS